MDSVLYELADEMAGEAIVGKVHESERALFSEFRVRKIPTLFVVRNGEVKQYFVGMRPKGVLRTALR